MNSMEIAIPQQESTPSETSAWRDWLGITASIGCAIHCAAMPFVIAYLPALGLSFLADEAFHQWMALFCFLIAVVAFIPGIFKHGSWVPVSIGSVGLVCITVAAFGLAGDCCAHCSSEENSVALAEDGSVEEESCCDDECEHCRDEAESESGKDESGSDDSGSDETGSDDQHQASLLTQLAPWITPFGGLLLVSAHLLNRRYGYACSCCVSKAAPTPKTI